MIQNKRKLLIDTLRFLSQDDPECDKCPMQDAPPDPDGCGTGCTKYIMLQAAQMLEDDGMIMKAWK